MKITILGCGWSMGVPIIGCDCPVCTSADPKNKRRRVSVLVEYKGTKILIDASPDLRNQLIDNNTRTLDGVLFTHEHSDHVNGIDDLRRVGHIMEKKIDIFGTKETIEALYQKFPHLFSQSTANMGKYKLCLTGNEIVFGQKFKVGNIEITPFEQQHGPYISTGYRIGDFVYSTDVNGFTDECFEKYLTGLELWVVDCQGYAYAYTHSKFETTMAWIERAKPKRAILTHMGHELDYKKLCSELPEKVEPAYDNMVINL